MAVISTIVSLIGFQDSGTGAFPLLINPGLLLVFAYLSLRLALNSDERGLNGLMGIGIFFLIAPLLLSFMSSEVSISWIDYIINASVFGLPWIGLSLYMRWNYG